ncbi:MAG: YqgE/AlgH family protein [Pseudomonadota bacterium]
MEIQDTLEGKFLIAMPGMTDPRFTETLVYMCAHSDGGAMGLIVNKPIPKIDFSELVEQLGVKTEDKKVDAPVFYGGPVEHARGFVLHSRDYLVGQATLPVSDSIALTGTLEILEDIATGHGPDRHLLALGYAGWAPNQLEAEIRSNGWLVLDGTDDLVFSDSPDAAWGQAFDALGIDRRLLSGEAGFA